MRLKRFANLLLLSAAATAAAAAQTFACPMCKASVANAENSDEISATINTAILILLAPTLALIGGLVKLVFKYRHFHNDGHYRARRGGYSPPPSVIEAVGRVFPAPTRGTVPVIKYVNFTTSGSERDTQQRQRDPAHYGLRLHSSEKDQRPPGFDD
jgi:hypothetical protein